MTGCGETTLPTPEGEPVADAKRASYIDLADETDDIAVTATINI